MNELMYMSTAHQTRAEYDARVKQLNDIRAAQSVKYNEGLAEGEKIGIEKGKAEGEKNAKIETAKRMLKRGVSIEDVADFQASPSMKFCVYLTNPYAYKEKISFDFSLFQPLVSKV